MEPNYKQRSGSYEAELGKIWTDAKNLYHEEMTNGFNEIRKSTLENQNDNSNSIQLQELHKKIVTDILYKFHREFSLAFDQRRKLRTALEFQLKKYQDEIVKIKKSMSKPILGIDLGTTYCCVAVYYKGKIRIVTNEIGRNTTPSYIAFDGDHSFIGQPAKDQAHMNPQNTIFDAKRLIGRKYFDDVVQKDMKLWPFQVVPDNQNPKIKVDDATYFPEEISAKILKALKKEAENFLEGAAVTDAVITVPAYFNNGQRQATKDAGKLAGLNILQILNEPTAAAITYDLHRIERSKRNVLIFDLGGGTFDVSILTIEDGSIKIRAVGGDTHLGGEDFDNSMVDYCIKEFKKSTGFDLAEGKDSTDAKIKFKTSKRLRRLRNECERQKVSLSFSTRAVVALDSMFGSEDLKVTLTRKVFEDLIEDKLNQCIEKVDHVMDEIGIQKEDIDDIVLVGGSSRIPKVQSLLTEYFNGKSLSKSIHPDEAVAWGAAIHGCLLIEGNESNELEHSVTISDVIPLSLGIRVRDGDFSRIIPKNTPVPFQTTKTYVTRYHNQRVMKLPIYEGEDRIANKNHLLGEILLENIPPGPAGEEQCEVVMKIDNNGLFTVEATALGNASSHKGIQICFNKDGPTLDTVDNNEERDDFERGRVAITV